MAKQKLSPRDKLWENIFCEVMRSVRDAKADGYTPTKDDIMSAVTEALKFHREIK